MQAMHRILRGLTLALVVSTALAGQANRVLYVTHSAGFRHGSLELSAETLERIAREDGRIAVEQTEDVSRLNAAALAAYDAVFFFTSGELPISDQQKQDLINFIRGGKGFGGVHSATDTFYTWPEYLEIIGARFNGHPWVQDVDIHVEAGGDPAVAHLGTEFRILAETYQFRGFSRERSRVLLALEPDSVDLGAVGANEGTRDFPLAWRHRYGNGRVFYTALGHFDETWRDERFQRMVLEGLLWLTGLTEAEAAPRPLQAPRSESAAVGNAADGLPAGTISPGSLISIFGEALTPGSSMAPVTLQPVRRLAGVEALLDGQPLGLIFASPGQINAYVRPDQGRVGETSTLQIRVADLATAFEVDVAPRTPGIFVVTAAETYLTLWATGLGPVESRDGLEWMAEAPTVRVAGREASVLYSGLAPGWLGLYQINVARPAGLTLPAEVEVAFGDVHAVATALP